MEYSDFTEDEIVFPGLFPSYEKHIPTQAFGGQTIARTCAIWGVDPIDRRFKAPVRSDVPVLLVAGTLDSLTPPSWAHEVAATLPNSHVLEIEGFAHSPTFASECTAMIALQFLADPSQAPDASCLSDLKLQFAVPE
jgi:pimeloyl-ACP methyl ester carboxylesterase